MWKAFLTPVLAAGAAMMASVVWAQAPAPYGAPISLEQARKVLATAEAESRRINVNTSIAILDSGGHLVLLQRMDSSQFSGPDVAFDKAYSAVAYRRAGKAFQDRLATGAAETRILRLRGASPIDGGDPIIVDGRIVGAIGVSGGTGEQDGQVSKAGAAALK